MSENLWFGELGRGRLSAGAAGVNALHRPPVLLCLTTLLTPYLV